MTKTWYQYEELRPPSEVKTISAPWQLYSRESFSAPFAFFPSPPSAFTFLLFSPFPSFSTPFLTFFPASSCFVFRADFEPDPEPEPEPEEDALCLLIMEGGSLGRLKVAVVGEGEAVRSMRGQTAKLSEIRKRSVHGWKERLCDSSEDACW